MSLLKTFKKKIKVQALTSQRGFELFEMIKCLIIDKFELHYKNNITYWQIDVDRIE